MIKKNKKSGGKHIAPKTKYNEVLKFYALTVDNFFENPDKIVRYAKSLPKHPDPAARWPGKRTKELWEINKELNDSIVLKVLICYYDLTYQDISWSNSSLQFQEIPRMSKNKNDVINKGWIHSDQGPDTTHELAGIIYLTPDIDPDSGTSLYQIYQRNDKEYKVLQKSFAKKILYKDLQLIHQMDFEAEIINAWSMKGQNSSLSDKDKFNEAYFLEKYKEQEELFTEKTRFANIYNRLIMYDTNEFHRANNYWNDDGKDPRLTLVFFIGGFNVGTFPLEKIKGGEYDEFIGHQSKIW